MSVLDLLLFFVPVFLCILHEWRSLFGDADKMQLWSLVYEVLSRPEFSSLSTVLLTSSGLWAITESQGYSFPKSKRLIKTEHFTIYSVRILPRFCFVLYTVCVSNLVLLKSKSPFMFFNIAQCKYKQKLEIPCWSLWNGVFRDIRVAEYLEDEAVKPHNIFSPVWPQVNRSFADPVWTI